MTAAGSVKGPKLTILLAIILAVNRQVTKSAVMITNREEYFTQTPQQ
jgi:hypothetical protein